MKPLRTLLMRAIVGALVLLALGGGLAQADTLGSADPAAGTAQLVLPEDPGIE